MRELATILLPTYNGQKYIKKMLESIILQDYRPIEVIISDDASKDNTTSIIDNYMKLHCNEGLSYRIIRNRKNVGLSGNISRAAKYVHGKYLFLADQDDIWKSNKISAQIEYMEKNDDCIMCICDRSIIDAEDKIICNSHFRYKQYNCRISQKWDYKMVLNNGPRYAANCICLRTDHLNKIFPIPRQLCSHDNFITIMAVHYGKIGWLNETLTLYRIHGGNLSGQYALETNKNIFKAGYIIFKGYKRISKRETIDLPIIKRELEVRFQEHSPNLEKFLYLSSGNNAYLMTMRYIFKNINKWKKFC